MQRLSAPETLGDLRSELASLHELMSKLASLKTMTAKQLAEMYQQVHGEPARTFNKVSLLRAIAWKLQEDAEGGLSAETLAQIAVLGQELPKPWRRRLIQRDALSAVASRVERDPRLPAPGTVISRVYHGESHEVIVQEQGCQYKGRSYTSLSAVARAITGKKWNGFEFFGLAKSGGHS